MLLAAASWEANAKALCSAYALHRIVSLGLLRQSVLLALILRRELLANVSCIAILSGPAGPQRARDFD